MTWRECLPADPVPWLLEGANAPVRHGALRHLLGRPRDDPDVEAARAAIPTWPPVAELLAAQKPDGYWFKRDYYLPKYHGTFWTLSVLADLGLTRDEGRIEKACEFMFTFQRESGAFCRRRRVAGQGIVWATEPGPCTHARIVRFLIQFGYGDDPRTRAGVNWILDNPRSDGMWHCREDRHNCLRATVDALRVAALDAEAAQHPAIQRGAEIVCNLLLQRGMTKYHVGSPWTTLEYPYVDYGLIPTLDALARLGYVADDPRITQAWNCLVGRQLPSGAWPLDRKRARLPFDVGQPGEANKWLTLDALKAIRQLHGA